MMPGYHPLLGLNGIEQMKCPSQRMSPSSNVGSRIKWTVQEVAGIQVEESGGDELANLCGISLPFTRRRRTRK